MIDYFINNYTEEIKRIEEEISKKRFAEIKSHAHFMKNTISNFNSQLIIDLFNKMQNNAEKEDINGVKDMFNEIKNKIHLLVIELKNTVKELKV